MNRRDSPIRRLLAPGVAVLLAALTVTVPAIDRGIGGRAPVLGGEHDPASCVVHHDHTICIQFSANRWAPGSGAAPRLQERPHALRGIHLPTSPVRTRLPARVRARSPPVA